MSVEKSIYNKLEAALEPTYLDVVNESHMHRGPASESHFKVIIVSAHFVGQRLLLRHRLINELLKFELAEQIHALALHTYTEEEWQKKQAIPSSPACSKK